MINSTRSRRVSDQGHRARYRNGHPHQDRPADRISLTDLGPRCLPARSPRCRRSRRGDCPRPNPPAQPQTPDHRVTDANPLKDSSLVARKIRSGRELDVRRREGGFRNCRRPLSGDGELAAAGRSAARRSGELLLIIYRYSLLLPDGPFLLSDCSSRSRSVCQPTRNRGAPLGDPRARSCGNRQAFPALGRCSA
jgi:hypothetical protein